MRDLFDQILDSSSIDELEDIVTEVERRLPPQKRIAASGHWLCVVLAEVAEMLDLGRLISESMDALMPHLRSRLEDEVGKALAVFITRAVQTVVSKQLSMAATQLSPFGHLQLCLCILAILFCPDPDHCPAADKLETPIVNALVRS
jgi:hypothetical protein